jgi:hypothetical protein
MPLELGTDHACTLQAEQISRKDQEIAAAALRSQQLQQLLDASATQVAKIAASHTSSEAVRQLTAELEAKAELVEQLQQQVEAAELRHAQAKSEEAEVVQDLEAAHAESRLALAQVSAVRFRHILCCCTNVDLLSPDYALSVPRPDLQGDCRR